MKKFRAFLVAVLMVVSSLFVVGSDATPVSATVSNCSRAGQYYEGGRYAQIACFFGYPGDAIRITITCKYYKWWSWHTYTVAGNWAYWRYYDPATSYPGAPGSTGWSTASCRTNNTYEPDFIIHVAPQTYPYASYWGYPFAF